MIDHDAALRFDTALDQLVRGERIPDDGLIDSARKVQQLDAAQQGIASAEFRAQLRAQFAGDSSANHLNGHHPVAERPIPAPLPKHPAQPRASHRWLAIAAVLLLLLAGGGAIVLEGFGLRGDPEPSAIPAVSFASPELDEQATGSPGATNTATSLTPQVPTALSDGTLYRIEHEMGDAKFTGLRAYRTKDSKRLWEIASSDFGNLLVAAGDTVFTTLKPNGSDVGQIVAYDADSGDMVWSMPSGGTVTGLTEADGVVYAVDSTGSVAAVDAATGKLRWAVKVDAGTATIPNAAGPTIITAAGYVAAVTPLGTLAVLDRANGEVAWSKDGYQPDAVMLAATTNMLIVTNLETFSYIVPGTPVTAGGSPESSPSAGATPLADATDGQEITSSAWNVTQYYFSNGGFFVGGGSTELTAPPTAIGDVVAIPGKAANYGGSAFGLNGQSSRDSGSVAAALPSEVEGKRITQLGTWTPPDGAPEQFVAVTEDGILTLVSPKHLGIVDNAEQDDPYDGAVVDLGQPVISQPIGDANDLWVTLADGTLLSINPLRLNQTYRQPTATTISMAASATPVASDAASPVQQPGATPPVTFTGSGIDWTVTPPDGARGQSAPGTIANGVFYRVLGTTDSQPLAQAIDLTSGNVLWEKVLDIWPRAIAATDDGFLIAGDDRGASEDGLAFAILDRATGDERWRAPLHQLPVELLAVDGQALVLGAHNLLTAFDLASQTTAWETDLTPFLKPSADEPGLLVYSGGRLAVSDGVVAAVADDGSIVAVDLTNGMHRWTYPHVSEGRTRLAVVDGSFAVVAINPGFAGYWVSFSPGDSTPPAETTPSPDFCSLLVKSMEPAGISLEVDSGNVWGLLALVPHTGKPVWGAEVQSWISSWGSTNSLLIGYYPRSGGSGVIQPNSFLCQVDGATGAATTVDGPIPDATGHYAYLGDDGMLHGMAVLRDGVAFPVPVDETQLQTWPLLDVDVASYGGVQMVQSVDGSILVSMQDGTLMKLKNPDGS